MDPLIATSLITSGLAFLGVSITAVFSYLATRPKNTKVNVEADLVERLEVTGIELQNEQRENVRLRNIIASKDIQIDELLQQLRKHAPRVNPADYHAPD